MRTRIPMNLSFLTEEEKNEAIEKCDERDESVSEHMQKHFRKLPHIKRCRS